MNIYFEWANLLRQLLPGVSGLVFVELSAVRVGTGAIAKHHRLVAVNFVDGNLGGVDLLREHLSRILVLHDSRLLSLWLAL